MSRTIVHADRFQAVRQKYEEAARAAPDNAVEAATRLLELSRKPALGPVISRALYAMAEVTTRLDQRAAGRAVGERTNLDVLLRVLEEAALLGPEADDPLADARLRWIVDRRRLAHAEGRPLPTSEVEALLGISRQGVAKARAEARLVGIPSRGGQYSYPSWQFGEAGVLSGLREVRQSLCDGEDPWAFTAFMVSPNSRLDGETPLAVLRRGRVDDVIRAAKAHGEHGAA